MFQTVSAETRKATARGNSHPQAAPAWLQAGPLPAMSNRAELRLQRKCDCGGGSDCNCDMADDKKKEEQHSSITGLHRAAAQHGSPDIAPPIVHEVLRSPGQTLDPETRAFFESRFDRDFSSVRIHTNSRAADSSRAVYAHAYTVGSNIAFASGRFSPTTAEGRQLLAHELTHVVQQSGSSAAHLDKGSLAIGEVGDSHEREASQIAETIDRGSHGVQPGASQPFERSVQAVVPRANFNPRQVRRQPAAAPVASSPPPTPAPLPATVPTPAPNDFQIDRVATSTQSEVFFARDSSTLTIEAQFEIHLLKTSKPGTVSIVGHASAGESASIAQDRANAVKGALTASPDPVNVSSATGNAAATESRSDLSRARSVEIVPAGGVPNTLDCKQKDAKGKLVNPPKQACDVMDPPTWAAFNTALPIATEATRKATDAVASTPSADDANLIDTFFGNHDPGTLGTLKTSLGNLSTHVANLKSVTSCGGQCDVGLCAEGYIAYNEGVGPAAPMTLCVPVFKSLDVNDEARNLIHESAHGTSPLGGSKGTGTQDVAYRHERMIIDPSLLPADKLKNSDSYALFAMRVREVRKTGNPDAVPSGISKPENDKATGFSGANDPQKVAAETALARLEKRLTWSVQWISELYGNLTKLRAGTVPATPGADPWVGIFSEPLMAEVAKGFPLTAPPAIPSLNDQTRLAAIFDRYNRMKSAVKTDLTLNRGAKGSAPARWQGAPASAGAPPGAATTPATSATPAAVPRLVASPSLEVGPDFFRATPEDQVSLLLEQLAAATKDVETAYIPAYVALAKWIHQNNP